MKDEIVLYQFDKLSTHLEVRVENETVWLNRQQIALLFDRDIKTIGKHIANVLTEELQGFSVVAKFATTSTDGNKQFAFSKMDKNSEESILNSILKTI